MLDLIPHVLIILFVSLTTPSKPEGGMIVGRYDTFELCDRAGRMASRTMTVEYVCIPAK